MLEEDEDGQAGARVKPLDRSPPTAHESQSRGSSWVDGWTGDRGSKSQDRDGDGRTTRSDHRSTG